MENRGVKVLIGAVAAYTLWQAWSAGTLDRWGLMLLGQEFALSSDGRVSPTNLGGPLATAFEVAIDLLAIVGEVAILLASGLWTACRYLWGQIGEFFGAARVFLRESAAEKQLNRKAAATPTPAMIAVAKPTSESILPPDAIQTIVGAIKEVNVYVKMLTEKHDALAAKVTAHDLALVELLAPQQPKPRRTRKASAA